MLARYRYRAYPSPGQSQMLARTFGCARVVFNDSLRLREEAHAAGERISDTEVQRRVITLAKATPERAWLAEVPSVARYGRQVVKVGRWFPSSQICSMCGRRDGPKPLHVREWTWASCGSAHDRDINAARNIRLEGRKVAAGQADTLNGCGAGVRPGPAPAAGSETATRRSAA